MQKGKLFGSLRKDAQIQGTYPSCSSLDQIWITVYLGSTAAKGATWNTDEPGLSRWAAEEHVAYQRFRKNQLTTPGTQ